MLRDQTLDAFAKETLFISIASYCDELLWWTIESAWTKATHPDRLVFGVVDQSLERAAAERLLSPWGKQTRYLHVDAIDSRGACWARHLANGFYASEDYFLQIDSHTLFAAGWDEKLIADLAAISKNKLEKILLSTRPFGFEFAADGTVKTRAFSENTLVLSPNRNSLKSPEDPLIKFDAVASDTTEAVPGFQIAAGFVFSRGSLIDEVPYDPQLYFHGEEQSFSIRAFTRGWKIWHPNAPPLYHHYRTVGLASRKLHWDATHDAKRSTKWIELNRQSIQRVIRLLNGELNGAYGLGSEKTRQEYYETVAAGFVGVSSGLAAA